MKKTIFVFLASFSMLCCMIFKPVQVNAYASEYHLYPINWDKLQMVVVNTSGSTSYVETVDLNTADNKYYFNNPDLSDIDYIIFNRYDNTAFTFPYDADLYDYYFIGTVVGNTGDNDLSTFKPQDIILTGYDVSTESGFGYPYDDLNIYNIDTFGVKGFGFSERVHFSTETNIGINGCQMVHDKDGSGNKPAGLVVEFAILAIDKGSSIDLVIDQILTQLNDMEFSINNSISNAADQIVDETLHGYDNTTISDANTNLSSGAEDLTAIENQLSSSSTTYINDFTTTGFNAGVLASLGNSLTFVVTWFTNFWNMGGIWTAGLNVCFAISIAFYILKTRSK